MLGILKKCGDVQITQASEHPVERRRAVRYRTGSSAIFQWEGPENRRFQGTGITRDMSLNGVYILTAVCPPSNAVVQMEVFVAASEGVSRLRMKAEMTVLRVETNISGSNHGGFAAEGKEFLLHTVSKRGSRLATGAIEEPAK